MGGGARILFARVLAETIAGRTGRVVLDHQAIHPRSRPAPDRHPQAFGLDADRMEAVAVYDAAITRRAGVVEPTASRRGCR